MITPFHRPSNILSRAIDAWYYKRAKKVRAGDLIQEHDERKSLLLMREFLSEDAQRMKEKRERAKQHTGSTLGGCPREKWFKHYGAEGPLGPMPDVARTMRIFENGTLFHVRMQVLFQRMGILRAREFRVDCDLGTRGFRGSIDAIIELEGSPYLVELKSAGNAFHALGRYGPSDSYLVQCGSYQYAYAKTPQSARPTKPPKSTLLLYESKLDQNLREFVVTPDEKFFKELETHAEDIDESIKTQTLPVRPYSDPDKYPCSFCDFVDLCYNRMNLKKFLKTLTPPSLGSEPPKPLLRTSRGADTQKPPRPKTLRNTLAAKTSRSST